jgi:hypothetical protein
LDSKNEEIQTKIRSLNKKLNSIEEPIKKLLDDKILLQKKLDQKTFDRCNKFLSRNEDDDVQWVMEHLIGILTGTDKSYTFWVEMYLKSYNGFMLALDKIDYTAQTTEY